MDASIRLQPFVWSTGQALGWGTLFGALCGLAHGLIDVWTLLPHSGRAVNFFAQLVWKMVLLGGLSGLLCAAAVILRNIVTRPFYARQKLDTPRRGEWALAELALAGFCTFGVFPFVVMIIATRLFGLPGSNERIGSALLGFAVVGAVYLPIVGATRNHWVRRRAARS